MTLMEEIDQLRTVANALIELRRGTPSDLRRQAYAEALPVVEHQIDALLARYRETQP